MTNPLGAAENHLIGSALGGRGTRRSSGGRARTGTTSGNLGLADLRAAEGQAAHNSLVTLLAVERERFAPIQRPVVAAVAPLELAVFARQQWSARKSEAHWWQSARRKALRRQAMLTAQAMYAAAMDAAVSLTATQQAEADRWWGALNAGDADVMTAALVTAFADNPAPVQVIRAEADQATLLLLLPTIEVLPERKAHITPGGKLTTKAWTKTELNDVYADLLGAHLVATLRETWAVGLSLREVRVVGARAGATGLDPLFDVTLNRDPACEADDSYGGRVLNEAPQGLRRAGRTREVAAWRTGELKQDVAPYFQRQ